ncbi:MAG TPA: 23S rRNA (pseudouridine(1915)-N(3))-methyltransferase RlmH [Candidatus Polarisedimenticolaceae bacterium]|nr:23S rRNA (pseudouridine(1915)-N(3))-methyltransferase RlmH [Candidatus Polarisedimenticolaceae bacterium]
MRILLLTVGAPRDRELAALHDRYAHRLERLGVPYASAHVPDVASGGRYSDEHVREREAQALLERLGVRDRCIALDSGGLTLSSAALAQRLPQWATPRATFVVGGPLGLHASVLERAETGWSLSALTFPHELVRVLVVEQLYRAAAALRGIPYAR